MKLKKLTGILGAATLSAALLLSGCGQTSGNQSQETTAAAVEEASEVTPEATESVNAPAAGAESQYADQCRFILEGKEYTLPFDYSQLEADGWVTDLDTSQTIDGLTYTFFYAKKSGKDTSITFDIFNGTGNAKKLSECKITGIEVSQKQLESYSFELGNSLKPGDDKETVKTVMGTPTDSSDQDQYENYRYGKTREEGQIVFTWWKDAKTVEDGQNSIDIAYMPREETASSSETPDYLSEYKAPDALGNDFDSATFTLDGVTYQLPCPASEFVKNGWTITKTADVMAGRTAYGKIEKDGIALDITFSNYADYQTDGSNCAVSGIEASVYGDDPAPDLTVPMGISFASGKDDLDTNVKNSSVEFSKDENDSMVLYYYDNYDSGTSAKLYFYKDNNRVSSIRIGGNKWPGK